MATLAIGSTIAVIFLFLRRLPMTTLTDRPNTALIVIDLQIGVVANAYKRDEVLKTVNAVIERARQANAAVVWVVDDGLEVDSADWQIVPELSPASQEPIVRKNYRDAFEGTELEQVLGSLGVGKLIVVGAQTDMCIRSTLHGAIVRGYDASLVSDAHTTEDRTQQGAPPPSVVISHTNMYWATQKAPERAGGVVMSEQVDFS